MSHQEIYPNSINDLHKLRICPEDTEDKNIYHEIPEEICKVENIGNFKCSEKRT